MNWKELFTTDGRYSRQQFWIVTGCISIISLIAGGILSIQSLPGFISAIIVICLVPFWIIAIITQVKRWHDRNKSGWWVFIGCIPYIGAIWALVENGFLKGTAGPNRFGPDPLLKDLANPNATLEGQGTE